MEFDTSSPEGPVQFDTSPLLDRLIGKMACPVCRGDLSHRDHEMLCASCDIVFPTLDGFLCLAVRDTAHTEPVHPATMSSADYREQYAELTAAAQYNDAYKTKRTKRWSTSQEFRLLRRLLGEQVRCETILNIPCGGGRLSEIIAEGTDVLIEADTAIGQLRYARQDAPDHTGRLWLTATAQHIPFKDRSVDGVVCCRLNHHLPTVGEREQLLKELLRVARRFVIMTFFDHHSPKNHLRRIRSPFNNKPPKLTMTRQRVSELAHECGARCVSSPALSYWFSGHRYALFEKTDEVSS